MKFKVRVSGLDATIQKKELSNMFSAYKICRIWRADRKDIAYVSFLCVDEAIEAIEKFNER